MLGSKPSPLEERLRAPNLLVVSVAPSCWGFYTNSTLWGSPAMHNDGPCVRQTFLSLVDLVQETEDTPRLTGDPMVRPAQVLVVPYLPNQVPLDQGQRGNVRCFRTKSLSLFLRAPHRLENKSRLPAGRGLGTLTLSSGEICNVRSLYSAVSCSLQLVTE